MTLAHLRHCVAEHQAYWYQYVQLLTNAHSTQFHPSTGTTPFTLVLSRQPPGPTTLYPASDSPDNMTGELESVSFRNRFFYQLDILRKETDAKHKKAQAHYKRNFDRTIWRMPQLQLREHVFFDIPLVQMTESARMAGAHLTKSLQKTVVQFKVISVAPDTVTLDDNGILNTISVDRVMLTL